MHKKTESCKGDIKDFKKICYKGMRKKGINFIIAWIFSSLVWFAPRWKKYPFGVVAGFIMSFTFFTLFLTTLVSLTGISANLLRYLSVLIILIFGLVLVIPKLGFYFESLISKLGLGKIMAGSQSKMNTGFFGGFFIGFLMILGMTSCISSQFDNEAIVENYVRGHIAELSLVEPVLGGSWYVVSVDFPNDNMVVVTYEDGHIQESFEATYKVDKDGEVVLSDVK